MSFFRAVRQHWPRVVIALLPVLLSLVHATGTFRFAFVDRLDNFIYDTRLRATLPHTLDPRVVIVDIDDASLRQIGQWPWGRDKLAALTAELTDRQQATVVGFDVVFAEPDSSSGLETLRRLMAGPLGALPGMANEIDRLAPALDRDAAFARALHGHRVALGFFLTQSAGARASGQIGDPVLAAGAFPAGAEAMTRWTGFGGNIAPLADAAASSGFMNVMASANADGLVRAAPLLARYDGQAATAGYYESLGLAVYRLASEQPAIQPSLAPDGLRFAASLDALRVQTLTTPIRVPVDRAANMLVPFRGQGGPRGGSFRYIPAADVLGGKLDKRELQGKMVLVGTTAPGLQDLRATPIAAAFPGVEIHANVISAMLDRRFLEVPNFVAGYETLTLLLSGLLLAIGLSILSVGRAVALGAAVTTGLIAVNGVLYLEAGLVLPLASALVMTALVFALSMSWGYFIEARVRRSLAELFGTYVPPQLVREMLVSPSRYSMRAESREVTVMFCDMRDFTQMSEQMAPTELQAFLNVVFSRLTEIISAHRGTVDKYMGDCVMAFWGAPVDTPDHAELAVTAALKMAAAVHTINDAHRASGYPEISVGIGINTGVMSVGDMGSAVRRSYTVVGDAVNLASRLEGLSGHFGVEVIASEATRLAAPGYLWQELDRVRVKGKAQAVAIFSPVARMGAADARQRLVLERWEEVLTAYKAQDWATGQALLAPLLASGTKKVLYQLYADRLASMALRPEDPDWDGVTRFENK